MSDSWDLLIKKEYHDLINHRSRPVHGPSIAVVVVDVLKRNSLKEFTQDTCLDGQKISYPEPLGSIVLLFI